MKPKTIAILGLVIGSLLAVLFLALPPRLVASWGLGIIRHNDRALIGAIGLLTGAVSAYNLYTKQRKTNKRK